MQTNKQILAASLFLSGCLVYSGAVYSRSSDGGTDPTPEETIPAVIALNDTGNITNTTASVDGDVSSNDLNSIAATLTSSVLGRYGSLAFDNGAYTYTLFTTDPDVANLKYNQSLTDTFTYRAIGDVGAGSASASLTIHIFGSPDSNVPIALDDVNNIARDAIDDDGNAVNTVEGNVSTNDTDSIYSALISPIIGQYGSLNFSNDGAYIYTLFIDNPEVLNLDQDQSLTDTFTYEMVSETGATAQANLSINIFGASGTLNDNVELEPNNRSYLATALNSGRNMRGQLQSGGDKDWYSIQSAGNEIIHLELCPEGSACFAQKGWVMYVFDGSKLTTAQEEKTYPLILTGDTTGVRYGVPTSSNHLYLNYRTGAFGDSLIGVIDPCFGTTSTLDIGVGNGNKTYYVAISSPLEGSTSDGSGAGECGVGSVVLEKPGPDKDYFDYFSGGNGDPERKTETTTQEYISILPSTDDQYQFLVARTGVDPLIQDSLLASSISGKSFIIPKLKISDNVYYVEFEFQDNLDSSDAIKIDLSGYHQLDDGASKSFIAYFDEDTNTVQVPKYEDSVTHKLYSLVFSLDPATGTLELLKYSPVE